MRIADAATGEVKEIFEEKAATQYESGQGSINWHFLAASNEIIWYSERDYFVKNLMGAEPPKEFKISQN